MVRRTGTGYECTICGEALHCGVHAHLVTVIIQSSGQPNRRSILCDGVEIHRCKTGNLKGGKSRPRFP